MGEAVDCWVGVGLFSVCDWPWKSSSTPREGDGPGNWSEISRSTLEFECTVAVKKKRV